MKVIGLTGGMGMGKSTAAAVFRRAKIPVFDADKEVHKMQARGGTAVDAIARRFPTAVRNGRIDRTALREVALASPESLLALEAILHPLVQKAEHRFLANAQRRGAALAVLDVPLLFETDARKRGRWKINKVIVISAPPDIQRARLRARRGANEPQLKALMSRQWTDAKRRRYANWVVPSGLSRHFTQARLRRLIAMLREQEL